MIRYTLGVCFNNSNFNAVLLLLKNKPEWQAGNYNCPGGKLNEGETEDDCISRKFKEETGLNISNEDWEPILVLTDMVDFEVGVFTCIYNEEKHGRIKSTPEEPVDWFPTKYLPKNIISNLEWLIPMCKDYLKNGKNIHSITIYGDLE